MRGFVNAVCFWGRWQFPTWKINGKLRFSNWNHPIFTRRYIFKRFMFCWEKTLGNLFCKISMLSFGHSWPAPWGLSLGELPEGVDPTNPYPPVIWHDNRQNPPILGWKKDGFCCYFFYLEGAKGYSYLSKMGHERLYGHFGLQQLQLLAIGGCPIVSCRVCALCHHLMFMKFMDIPGCTIVCAGLIGEDL